MQQLVAAGDGVGRGRSFVAYREPAYALRKGPQQRRRAGLEIDSIKRRGDTVRAQGGECDVGPIERAQHIQTGIAGSVVVGRGVMMGGQVGIADHITVGDGAHIAAKSGVIGDVAAGITVAGYPAVERKRWLRGLAELYRLASRRGGSVVGNPEGEARGDETLRAQSELLASIVERSG